MCTLTVTDTKGTDEDIDKWLEKIEEKKEEQKQLEERLTFKGADVKSVTKRFIEEISMRNSFFIEKPEFDTKA